MQSPGSVQSPGATQPDSSFFGKINLFAAPPNASSRTPITSSDAFRFQVGVNYKAKIIGIENVEEARGDRMCQMAIQKQKAFIKATGSHKQRIFINVSLEGIKLVDLTTGATLHHHPVQRISFISRDVSDARAFGYIYGPGDGTHKFFGIKTEKAAENVVLTLRDLFQVVFEMKKKESEDEKKLKLDNKETSKAEEKPSHRRRIRMLRKTEVQETKEEVEVKPEQEAEPASSGLMELETEMISLGFGQASQSTDFDPLTSGEVGGGSNGFSAQPQSHNAFAQGFGGDPFATNASTAQVPSNLSFSPPAANPMGGQPPNAWATFSPGNPPPAAGGFPQQPPQQPAAGTGFGGSGSPFGGPAQPMQSSNPFGGGFGAAPATGGGGGFGAALAPGGFGGGTAASFGGDQFGGGGGSLLAPIVTEVPQEPEAPKPPKRGDMFHNLVDGFGADFGKQKEAAPAPKMNELASKQQQPSPFGNNTVSDLSGDVEEGFGDSDPFDTSSVQREIRAQEMETAPNVYTKQISFSESENDLTPDRDVPAPSLPPPPLPSSVHSSNSTLHYPPSPGPTPPPRPGSEQQQLNHRQHNTSPLSHRDQAHTSTSTFLRGQTVDLGSLPDSPPPPPPPRPGSRPSGAALLGRQTVSYSAVPRPHPSPKLRHSGVGGPESPSLIRHSPHHSPQLQRQITAPALHSHPPSTSHSPQFTHQVRLYSDKSTPPASRKQEFFPPTTSSEFAQPAPSQSSGQFQANFADFSNFSQQISTTSSENVESPPPPPPPRQGSGRQKAPKLSMESRSITMPAPTEATEFNDQALPTRNNHIHSGGQKNIEGDIQSDASKTAPSDPDPFALTLPNPKKTRNVDSAYARPRPKARSKTPTLISTKAKSKSKSSLSAALRSDSPLSQNSISSREYEAANEGGMGIVGVVSSSRVTRQRSGDSGGNNAGHNSSPKDTRLSSSHVHNHRTGTPVSMHSMQSASSGHSGGQPTDPFAHIDPFETRDTADPFEQDPFVGSDPFKSPPDPFSKELSETEFKTKAIAITADGLEVSEESTSPSVINGNPEQLAPNPDPFGNDPFSMIKDPFHDKAKLRLDQPLLGGPGRAAGEQALFDPFDTAHVADRLAKPSAMPEFSNNCDSGIVGFQSGNNTGSQDLFRDFTQPAELTKGGTGVYGGENQPSYNQDVQSRESWAADFSGTGSSGHADKFITAQNHRGVMCSNNSDDVQHSQYSQTPHFTSQTSDPSNNSSSGSSNLSNHHHHHSSTSSVPPTQPPLPVAPTNHVNNDHLIFSSHTSNSPANHPPGSNHHGVYPSRERHESDSTSYNSEISEAFAPAAVTSPSFTNQNAAATVNGRNTPGSNPFLMNNASTPVQTPAGNAPLPTSGSLLDF